MRETLCQHDISLLWQWGFCVHKHTTQFKSITVARTVLTPPAVSRVGIKIWHPQRSTVDTSWAWSQRKCLSPPLSTPAFSLLHTHKSILPSSTPFNLSFYLCLPLYSLLRSLCESLQGIHLLIPPSLPSLIRPSPTCKTFPVTQRKDSANFSSLLEQHLCGTVALQSADDFIQPLLAWMAFNTSGEWMTHKCWVAQVMQKMQQ